MTKINLLPKEIQEKGKGSEWVILGASLIAVLAVVALSAHWIRLKSYEKDLKDKSVWEKKRDEEVAKVTQVTALDAQKSTLQAKKNTVAQLLQGRVLYPHVMQDLFSSIGPDIWLTNVAFKEDPQRNVSIEANAQSLSVNGVADWYEKLDTNKARYSGVSLSAIESKKGTTPALTSYAFKMTFIYHPPALSSGGS